MRHLRLRLMSVAFFSLAMPAVVGCAPTHLSRDFGVATRQDVAAQIADPDAHYLGKASPGSNGARVGLAQKRYVTGTVIPPATLGADNAVAAQPVAQAAPATP